MILIIYLDLLDKIFKNNNYKHPQPLIKIFGISIIEWILNYIDIDNFNDIIILYNSNEYDMKNIIDINKYKNNFIFEYFNNNIILTILELFNRLQLEDSPILYIDTKNFIMNNNFKLYNLNTIFYTNEENSNEKKIYIDLNTGLLNKKKISNNVIIGFFGFRLLYEFIYYCKKIDKLNNLLFIKNELSIVNLINLMISEDINFNLIKINSEDVINVETPFNIRLFCNNFPKINALNNNLMINRKRICFNLDNIIDMNNFRINIEKINFFKYLKNIGNILILETTLSEIEFDKLNINNILSNHDLLYDEISFNKPIADYYIDSKNIILDNNIEKELGFYNNKIDAREFNNVELKDIKTYKKRSNDLSGEIYYYLNIPNKIKDIFPVILNYDIDNKWYEMENINGIPINKLYLNEEFTLKQFDNVIGTINRIHNCEFIEEKENIDIYGNYKNKLKKRYIEFDYSKYIDSEFIYNFLIYELDKYEKNNMGKYSIIHGDTVFTNILINKFGKIKLIDMRGKIDDTLTICGDKMYDWAKLYQSLIGYDEILENKFVSIEYKKIFINYFEEYFVKTYSEESLYHLKIITASLIFSLIPLHNNEKCLKYYELISKLNI